MALNLSPYHQYHAFLQIFIAIIQCRLFKIWAELAAGSLSSTPLKPHACDQQQAHVPRPVVQLHPTLPAQYQQLHANSYEPSASPSIQQPKSMHQTTTQLRMLSPIQQPALAACKQLNPLVQNAKQSCCPARQQSVIDSASQEVSRQEATKDLRFLHLNEQGPIVLPEVIYIRDSYRQLLDLLCSSECWMHIEYVLIALLGHSTDSLAI